MKIYDNMMDEQKGTNSIMKGNNPTPNKYDILKKSFNSHFILKQNVMYETFNFRQLKQKTRKYGMDSYNSRLLTAAENCEFHNMENEILGQIILGCTSQRLC